MIFVKRIFDLLRFPQWSKAAFVLLGVIYSGSKEYLTSALLAALAFCLVSSAVYIYNDLQDRKEDQMHPKKCKRPLACGDISLPLAICMLIVLLLSGLLLAYSISTTLLTLLGFYLVINAAYNQLLKNIPVVDVLCIASGFMLRVLAGTIGIGLAISCWLTWAATLISLLIALCKRRLEKRSGLEVRVVLKKYAIPVLDRMIFGTAIACFLTYLLYTVFVHDDSPYFLITLPFAALGLGRFVWISTHTSVNDDPISLFFKDSISCLNGACFYLLTMIALL